VRFKDFETAPRVSKEAFAEREPALRVDLINAQFDLLSSKHSVALLIAGDDRDGCQEVFDLLHEWLDARQLDTEVFVRRTHHEREYPFFWRYWSAIPRRGHIGLAYGHWMHELIVERFLGEMSQSELGRRVAEVCDFERTLAADGTVIKKLWIHTPRKELKRRLVRVKEKKHGWLAAEEDRLIHRHYKRLVVLGQELVEATHASHAPWIVVDGRDDEHRDLVVLETLLDALGAGPCKRLARPKAHERARVKSRLAGVRTPPKRSEEVLDARLGEAQARLSDLSYRASQAGLPTVLAFEGWDAAGKGGAIRRLTRAMAARDYRVVQIAAPSDEELARHYLWRFWRHMPPAGRMTIFDRSWYGRVLVELVEGFAQEHEWRRAYDEIVAFEQQLVADGLLLLKFWLEVDADEQLARFEAREGTPYKRYKITGEDYRNREKRDAYAKAADEMISRTHARRAAWLVVPANDKRHARVTVVEAVCSGLERALGR
jgi:polyphosphate:AMP phosphotransferase